MTRSQQANARMDWAGRFRGGAGLALLSLGMLLFSACDEAPLVPMRIGTNVWPGYEPLYLARELGYIGSEVRLIETTSASQVIRDFRNGILDAATLTLDETLQLAQDEVDLRIALVMDISNGADAIIAYPPIQSIADLKGRKIGVENTAVGAYLLTRALDKSDMTTRDIKLVPRRVHQHEEAFLKHEVEAIVTFEPTRTKLLQAGGRVIFDSSQIPNEIVDVLIVRGSYWDAQPQRVAELLTNWFRALDFMREQPEAAAEHLIKRLRVPAATVPAIYANLILPDMEENRRLLFGNDTPAPLALTAHALSSFMFDQGLLHRPPNLEGLLPRRDQWHMEAVDRP